MKDLKKIMKQAKKKLILGAFPNNPLLKMKMTFI